MTQRRVYQNRFPYFITTNTACGLWLFENTDYASLLSDVIFMYRETNKFDLYSYVIMSNHIHLLIKTCEMYDVSKVMRNIKGYFSNAMRNNFGFDGKIWQNRFHCKIVSSPKGLIASSRYIANNPAVAGMGDFYNKMPYMYIDTLLIETQTRRAGHRPAELTAVTPTTCGTDRRSLTCGN